MEEIKLYEQAYEQFIGNDITLRNIGYRIGAEIPPSEDSGVYLNSLFSELKEYYNKGIDLTFLFNIPFSEFVKSTARPDLYDSRLSIALTQLSSSE
jgi:hypothetical protein